MLHIFIEDEKLADLRVAIKKLDNRQLAYLEEVIKRERKKRLRMGFEEWQQILQECCQKNKNI